MTADRRILKMEKGNKKNVHEGHRERIRERFLAADETYTVIDNFSEHEILELLLFFVQPRVNTNETAHRLLNRFGNIRGVLEAPYVSLQQVEGIGKKTAMLIRVICALMRMHVGSDIPAHSGYLMTGLSDLVPLIRQLYFAETAVEHVYLMLFNAEGYHLKNIRISDGTPTGSALDIPQCVRLAVQYDAAAAILVHNHPAVAEPSETDRELTKTLQQALQYADIKLLDHLVLSENYCYAILEDRFI